MSGPRSRRRKIVDGGAIRDEVAERIEEATREPTLEPTPPDLTLPSRLIAPIPPRAPQKPQDAPEAPPTAPEPSIATPAVTAPHLGSYGNPSIDQHDALFVAASQAVQRKKGVRVSPVFMKAVMGVESGEDGNYPVGRCRPYDGYPGPLSCGPMQVKGPFHQQRCRDCDNTTLPGHIELAAHIIGDTMLAHRCDEYEAYVRGYLTSDDINGTSQQEAVAGLKRRVGQMDANAGPGTPEPAPVPAGDPMLIITGGVLFNDDYGWRDRAGVDYSNFAPGHGTFTWDEHPGIDLIVPPGTRLSTPAAGVVGCVGEHGTPQPGRSCGYYEDDGGGPGNITIKLDDVPGAPTTWLTIGHCRTTTVRPGERVTAGQQIGTVGLAGGGWHPHVETSILKDGTYLLLDPRVALAPFLTATPPQPTEPTFPWPMTWTAIAGTDRKIPLPADVPFKIQLTPRGPNRIGRPLNWTGVTQHETGNRGIGTGAQMHANWQRDGTQGHPDGFVGVHFYVDDTQIIQCIPVNEQGVHAGDWRNQQHVAIELCVNANRNGERAERNSMALAAGLLGWGMP